MHRLILAIPIAFAGLLTFTLVVILLVGNTLSEHVQIIHELSSIQEDGSRIFSPKLYEATLSLFDYLDQARGWMIWWVSGTFLTTLAAMIFLYRLWKPTSAHGPPTSRQPKR